MNICFSEVPKVCAFTGSFVYLLHTYTDVKRQRGSRGTHGDTRYLSNLPSRGDISAFSRLLGLGAVWKTCKLPRIDAWAVASSPRENRGVIMVQPD